MNTFGEWWNPTTWFDSSTPDVSTGTSSIGPTNDLFGWSSLLGGGQSTDIQAGVSDSQLNAWNTYWSTGGVIGADVTGTTPNPTTSSDIFGGFSDFLSGLTTALPGLAQTGLGVWQGIQGIINQQNPSDELVKMPGSNTPVIKRTQGGQTSYYPITQLYPNLAPQVQSAQQNSWIGPVVIAGVLGFGLILILKKK